MRRVMSIFLWLFLVLPIPAWAAMAQGATPTYDAHDGADTTLDITTSSLTAGRGLDVQCVYQDAADNSIVSIAIAGETNATLIGSEAYNATLGWSAHGGYFPALVGSGVKTVTVTFETTRIATCVAAELYDTVTGGIDLDASGGASNSTANPSIPVTTTSAGSAMLSVIYGANQITGYGAGYTQLLYMVWSNWEDSSVNLDVGASGAKTVDYTMSTGQWVAQAAAFKAASGGGGAPAETFGFRRRLQW